MAGEPIAELVEFCADAAFEIADADGVYAEALHGLSLHQLELVDLIGAAARLKVLGGNSQALALYKAWIAANTDHAILWAAYFNYSVALGEANDLNGSGLALRTAIQLNPDFCAPYINLGAILDRQGNPYQAVAEWMALVTKFPTVTGDTIHHKTMALNQIGRVLETTTGPSEAEEVLRQSLDINPEQPEVAGHVIALRQRQCKWPTITGNDRVPAQKLIAAVPPLVLAAHTDDAMFQLARAHQFNKSPARTPKARDLIQHPGDNLCRKQKLRIAYLSSDLRAHAVGFGMTDVFETHDHDRFEIFAYYCGYEWDDDTKARIRRSADHWTDINGLDDSSAAARIAADAIDILVDLNGYSKGERTGVFALRPAPIAVNWFGFPGTMGSPYHHYLIADDYIIPPDLEIYYSEKVVRLPCYQPNDRKRVVSSHCPTRQDVGLPEEGFVYCCLNGMQKPTSLTFARWMDILRQVPNSVIWLLRTDEKTNERVKQMASQQGIAPERVILADRANNPEHLARYALADLFLDTLPYGSHTTASDALWMGVPILTLSGRGFASRVCGSLVRAAGLPEMICSSAEDYVARAIALGHNRSEVVDLKQRLLDTRKNSLLFDTTTLVRSLEELYCQMWDAFARGERPVPDLRNLEAYHEIGLELDLETVELLSETSYRDLYRQKLTDLNAVAPIGPDGRFWQSSAKATRYQCRI
jgi:predicted O-linked N-acetylglucosamine transferase (SPINDLY family)